MTFYIAERNKETGKFELMMDRTEANSFVSESTALNMYKSILKSHGQDNVMIFEEVIVDVDLKVSMYEPGRTA